MVQAPKPGWSQTPRLVRPAQKKQDAARKRKLADAESAENAQDKTPLPERPARKVTAPTITSEELDRFIVRYLAKNDPKVEPAPATSDVEFVRRIYFDLIGKPPTTDQVQTFVRDRTSDKRAQLIERLLKSQDYARNWGKYWRDVIKFHSTSENPARVRFDALADFLATQFQANKPWDEITSALITATGRNDENGAVAFPWPTRHSPSKWRGKCHESSWVFKFNAVSVTTTRLTRGSKSSFMSSRHFSPVRGRDKSKSRLRASSR